MSDASRVAFLTALMIVIAAPLAFAQYGYGYGYGYQPPPGGGHSCALTIHAAPPSCDGNVFTVTGSSGSDAGIHVAMIDTAAGPVNSSDTNSDGQVSFPGCGMTVNIYASGNGCASDTLTETLLSCGQCAPAPKCTQDSDCASDQKCQINDQNASLNQCVPLQCGCGQTASNHQCQGSVWQCGAGTACNACPAGQACNADHVCQPSGCTSDLQCQDNEVCRTSSGAPGTNANPGSCQNVTGQCGYAANHAFVPYNYTCGTEPGCPSCPNGQACVDHQCVTNDINCPPTVVIGAQANCTVTQNNQACGPNDNCSTVITAPDGSNQTVNPDDAGNVLLGATLQGRYRIDLLKNGQLVKSVFVDVVAQTPPTPTPTPSATGGPDYLSLVWLLLLLLIIIGAVLYWRSRSRTR